MKKIAVRNIMIFLVVILSLFFGPSLSGEQPQKKTQTQQLEKNKKDINEEAKDNSKEEKTTKKEKFDYGPLTTLLGILTSAMLIIWQMGRQHKNNIKLQRENNREKLKLEIYNEYRKNHI